jgi:hypothetical protein
MRKLIVKIREPNKAVPFRNRVVRTPVSIEIYENELDLLEGQLRLLGVADYEVGPFKISTEDEDNTFDEVLLQNDEEVIIEDLCEEMDEPKTILDKLIRDNK